MKKNTTCIQLDATRKIKFKIDTNGRILYVNNYFTEFTGFSIADVILKDFEVLGDESMPKFAPEKLRDLAAQYDSFHFIFKGAMKQQDSCYWGFVHVRKTIDHETGKTKGLLIEIKMLPTAAIAKVEKMHDILGEIEKNAGIDAARKYFEGYIEEKGLDFESYVLSLVEIDAKKADAYFEIDEDKVVKKKKKKSWF